MTVLPSFFCSSFLSMVNICTVKSISFSSSPCCWWSSISKDKISRRLLSLPSSNKRPFGRRGATAGVASSSCAVSDVRIRLLVSSKDEEVEVEDNDASRNLGSSEQEEDGIGDDDMVAVVFVSIMVVIVKPVITDYTGRQKEGIIYVVVNKRRIRVLVEEMRPNVRFIRLE
jgi:hypothetical protein